MFAGQYSRLRYLTYEHVVINNNCTPPLRISVMIFAFSAFTVQTVWIRIPLCRSPIESLDNLSVFSTWTFDVRCESINEINVEYFDTTWKGAENLSHVFRLPLNPPPLCTRHSREAERDAYRVPFDCPALIVERNRLLLTLENKRVPLSLEGF